MYAIVYTPLENQQMAPRLAVVCTAVISSLEPTMSRPGRLSRNQGTAVYMTVTDEGDEFSVETGDVTRNNVEIQRMIWSAFHIFQGITVKRRMQPMVETEAVNFFPNVNQEASKGKKRLFYKAVRKVVSRVVARAHFSRDGTREGR